MNNNRFNSSPEEKRKQDEDLYQKFIMLGIVPLFIYLMWPFLFNTNKIEAQAQVVEKRTEKVDEQIEQQVVASPEIDETTLRREEVKVAPVPAKPKRTPNKIQPGTIKKRPVKPNSNQRPQLTYNVGDKIEYLIQNAGWKGVVKSKQNGSYTVKITEVVTANAQQQYLPGNNPCYGGKPIGKNAVNQVITVPGACIRANK